MSASSQYHTVASPECTRVRGAGRFTGHFPACLDAALCYNPYFRIPRAEVAELADALDSGSSERKLVGVQLPSSAPSPVLSHKHCRLRGVEPASGADRSGRVSATLRSAEARRRAAPADGGIAEAQAGNSPLRHHHPPLYRNHCRPRGVEPASGADRSGRVSATLRSAEARRRAAPADGESAEAQAGNSPLRHQGAREILRHSLWPPLGHEERCGEAGRRGGRVTGRRPCPRGRSPVLILFRIRPAFARRSGNVLAKKRPGGRGRIPCEPRFLQACLEFPLLGNRQLSEHPQPFLFGMRARKQVPEPPRRYFTLNHRHSLQQYEQPFIPPAALVSPLAEKLPGEQRQDNAYPSILLSIRFRGRWSRRWRRGAGTGIGRTNAAGRGERGRSWAPPPGAHRLIIPCRNRAARTP